MLPCRSISGATDPVVEVAKGFGEGVGKCFPVGRYLEPPTLLLRLRKGSGKGLASALRNFQGVFNVRFRVILESIDQWHILIDNLYNSSGSAHKHVQHIRLYPYVLAQR